MATTREEQQWQRCTDDDGDVGSGGVAMAEAQGASPPAVGELAVAKVMATMVAPAPDRWGSCTP
jgi:hypothetical protein